MYNLQCAAFYPIQERLKRGMKSFTVKYEEGKELFHS